MKLKKKTIVIIVLFILVLVGILGLLMYKTFFNKEEVKAVKVIASVEDYGYTLKDNKDARYKKMFNELKEILQADKVDYDKYASKISEMFIYDFYSLDNKLAKNDIGGVDFVHPDELEDFLENAESTYYKYVESNIYGNRNQSLPLVNEIEVGEVETTEFAVGNQNVDDAYKIKVTWNYTKEEFSDYQTDAIIILAKDGKKLNIVEVK